MTKPKLHPPWPPWPGTRYATGGGLDNGFWSEQNIAALEQRQIEPLHCDGARPHHQSWQARFAGEPEPPPADASSQVKMAYKLHTAAGQTIYRLRKCTVEPVFGIVKAVLGFRQFLLRGLAATSDEWCPDVSSAYNIKRYHTLSLGLTAPSAEETQQVAVNKESNRETA